MHWKPKLIFFWTNKTACVLTCLLRSSVIRWIWIFFLPIAAVIGRAGVGAGLGVWFDQNLDWQDHKQRLVALVYEDVCVWESLSLSLCHLSKAAGHTRLPPLMKERRKERKTDYGLLVGPSDHGLLRVQIIQQVSALLSKHPPKNLVMMMMMVWWWSL